MDETGCPLGEAFATWQDAWGALARLSIAAQ